MSRNVSLVYGQTDKLASPYTTYHVIARNEQGRDSPIVKHYS
jgi:hypothetical protein